MASLENSVSSPSSSVSVMVCGSTPLPSTLGVKNRLLFLAFRAVLLRRLLLLRRCCWPPVLPPPPPLFEPDRGLPPPALLWFLAFNCSCRFLRAVETASPTLSPTVRPSEPSREKSWFVCSVNWEEVGRSDAELSLAPGEVSAIPLDASADCCRRCCGGGGGIVGSISGAMFRLMLMPMLARLPAKARGMSSADTVRPMDDRRGTRSGFFQLPLPPLPSPPLAMLLMLRLRKSSSRFLSSRSSCRSCSSSCRSTSRCTPTPLISSSRRSRCWCSHFCSRAAHRSSSSNPNPPPPP
mmetsp:Transcript_22288/g.63960  ORF Transcript_22288/g.63960 Transcript_22288/m.63960 type:complete len:295 (-) Transcript_22288:608-1492(-)